jgi:hypothetical protein
MLLPLPSAICREDIYHTAIMRFTNLLRPSISISVHNFALPAFFASSSWYLTFNNLLKIFPLALFGMSFVNLTPPLNFL